LKNGDVEPKLFGETLDQICPEEIEDVCYVERQT